MTDHETANEAIGIRSSPGNPSRDWLDQEDGVEIGDGYRRLSRDEDSEPTDEFFSASRRRWEMIGEGRYRFRLRRRKMA